MNPIESEEELNQKLDELYPIFHVGPDDPEWERMNELCDVIEAYETIHYPMDRLRRFTQYSQYLFPEDYT